MIYEYLNLEIKKVEAVSSVLNDEVDNKLNSLDDIEDLEHCKHTLVDFMVSVREQMNLLYSTVDSLNKLNNDLVLNGSRKPDEHIKPLSDMKFKKERLRHRY